MDVDFVRNKLIEGNHKVWQIEMEIWKGGRCMGCRHWENSGTIIDDSTMGGYCALKKWPCFNYERCADFAKTTHFGTINFEKLHHATRLTGYTLR